MAEVTVNVKSLCNPAQSVVSLTTKKRLSKDEIWVYLLQ